MPDRNSADDIDTWVMISDSPNFSAALRQMAERLAGGNLMKANTLADRIDRGGATESESEIEKVYETVVELADYVIDLTNMVRRREEFIANHGFSPREYSEIGFVAARP